MIIEEEGDAGLVPRSSTCAIEFDQWNRPALLCCLSLSLDGQDEKLALVIYGQA